MQYSINAVFKTLEVIILVRLVLSFIQPNMNNNVIRFFYDIGNVLLYPGKLLFSKLGINTGRFDFSPVVSIMLLRLLHEATLRLFT